MLGRLAVIATVAATIVAESSSSTSSAAATTTNVFLPIVASQELVASVSATADNDIKTMVIACPSSVETSKCGFEIPVTVTAGPSTVALTTVIGSSMTVDLKCGIEDTTKASCTQVYTGPASLQDPSLSGDNAKSMSTWTASQKLETLQVSRAFLPVSITAGGAPAATSKGGAPVGMAVPTGFARAGRMVVVGFMVREIVAAVL